MWTTIRPMPNCSARLRQVEPPAEMQRATSSPGPFVLPRRSRAPIAGPARPQRAGPSSAVSRRGHTKADTSSLVNGSSSVCRQQATARAWCRPAGTQMAGRSPGGEDPTAPWEDVGGPPWREDHCERPDKGGARTDVGHPPVDTGTRLRQYAEDGCQAKPDEQAQRQDDKNAEVVERLAEDRTHGQPGEQQARDGQRLSLALADHDAERHHAHEQ